MMFTDVVGYTALMQRDEEAAVSAHGGDLLQYLGDGSLTMFPSVVDAVRAAIDVQGGLRQEPVVPLRIGIHQGDISYDTQGAYGDSVNVASRIQSLATSGSILISAKAHDEIKNQPDITTTPLGEFELKNVEESLEVFGIVSDVLAVPTRNDVLTEIRRAPATALHATIRLNTALEGRYRVGRELGQGGMATVYLAEDLRHERKVALKILKPEIAAAVGAERFLAEIKTTAKLQHPHILPLHDSGEADGFLFYVMPYVGGESLRERLNREHQLSVDEGVRIATNIAEALDYAHRQGVIHRDIKPGNVLIHDGQAVISDFGIALAVGPAGGDRLTETGLSVGTPHYMSPEQATGDHTVGPATDTYALGCVLYEMLVGEPPYTGRTAQVILGKSIAGEPVSATEHRPSVPANVDAAIKNALEKLPADRFTGAQDFALALGDEHFRYGELVTEGASAAAGPWKGLSIALALALAVTLGWSLLSPEPPTPLARFSSPFEEGQFPARLPSTMEFMADGSALVYVGPDASGGGTQLWLRRWADLDATPIRGTEGAIDLSLSPDGREVAFVAQRALRVAPLDGGPSRALVELDGAVWEWTSDGTVYFTESPPSLVLARVPAAGGGSEAVESTTERLEGEAYHGFLSVLPGGTMGVFQVMHSLTGEDAEVWAIDLDSRERRFLTAGTTPRYASTGHLLFVTPDGVLMAQPIDPATAELTSAAVPVAEGLALTIGIATYEVSESGTLIYSTGDLAAVEGIFEPVWVTRSGEAAPVDPGWRFNLMEGFGLMLSPDGARVAITQRVDGNEDVWIKQLPDGPLERLTSDDLVDTSPFWSPDGQFVAYSRSYDVWQRRADGTGAPELLFDEDRSLFQGRWSLDGEWIVFRTATGLQPSPDDDIVGFRPGVDSAAIPLVASAEFSEQSPALSPNGRWLAYTSDRTGRREVYVRPFPDVDSDPVSVSHAGGDHPLWAHSGSELFFVDAQGGLVAAGVEADSVFRVLQRETLFTIGSEYLLVGGADFHDIRPDDEKFLMVRGAISRESSGDTRFILVENWFTELRERMGN